MSTATILSNADFLVIQRTDPEVFNLGIIAPLLKQSKVLMIVDAPPSTPTHLSLSVLSPILHARLHSNPINLVTFATTQPLLQHHSTHLFDLTFNVDVNVNEVVYTLDTIKITKIAITSHALSILTETLTTPPITAPTSTTTSSPTAYSLSHLSVHTAHTRSQPTPTHPSLVGYQSDSTLYLRDPSPLPHRS